jgi:hypothetical protein
VKRRVSSSRRWLCFRTSSCAAAYRGMDLGEQFFDQFRTRTDAVEWRAPVKPLGRTAVQCPASCRRRLGTGHGSSRACDQSGKQCSPGFFERHIGGALVPLARWLRARRQRSCRLHYPVAARTYETMPDGYGFGRQQRARTHRILMRQLGQIGIATCSNADFILSTRVQT